VKEYNIAIAGATELLDRFLSILEEEFSNQNLTALTSSVLLVKVKFRNEEIEVKN
jgi:hypothetical protein